MDLPLAPRHAAYYRFQSGIKPDDAYERLEMNRRRTWTLLNCAEVAWVYVQQATLICRQCLQRGRMAEMTGLHFAEGESDL